MSQAIKYELRLNISFYAYAILLTFLCEDHPQALIFISELFF
jgi:hypothetical protein